MIALARQCLVCGLPLAGPLGAILKWFGIGRSSRNPHCCTRCNTHIEEGRLVEITMIFADLSSFTEMTHKLGDDSTFHLVDQYLRLATEVFTSHGAFIDKYIGDAVMAIFNVPVKRKDHARAAVAAARELLDRLPTLSERLGEPLRASIGIATGFARVGRLGSDDVKDYTAVGAVVNQAARLQSQAGAGEILISEGAYRPIAADYPNLTRESLSLKGFHEAISAYRIGGDTPQLPGTAPLAPPNDRSLGVGALLMALLGAGCLGSSILGAVSLTLGMGSFLVAAAIRFDQSPVRLPLLVFAVVLAISGLASLARNDRLRREYRLRHACVVDTPGERRRHRIIAWLCYAAIAFVGLELVMHFIHNHRV